MFPCNITMQWCIAQSDWFPYIVEKGLARPRLRDIEPGFTLFTLELMKI